MKILQLHLKLLIRTKWCWLFFPLFCFFSYGAIYDSLYNLSLSGYVTQTLIFFGAMFAYYNHIRKKKEVGEYVSVLPYFRTSQMWMILAESIYIVLLLLLMTGFVFVYGVYLGAEGWLLKEAMIYCFIYFWLPCFVSLSYGYIMGSGTPRKFHVLLIIGVGLLVGPVMRHFWYCILAVSCGTKIADKIIGAISIGQVSICTTADSFYGFQIEQGRIYYLLFIIGCLWSIYFLKKRRRGWQSAVAIIVTALMAILYLNSGRYVIYDQMSEELSARENYDLYFYMEHESFYHAGNSVIEGIEGNVKLRKNLFFEGRLKLRAKENIKDTSFILYHDLEVKNIEGENVKGFEQKADSVRVYFDKEIQKGEVYFIKIKYEGYSSPYFYSNEKGCFLPGYFAWLPFEGEGSCFKVKGWTLKLRNIVNENQNYDIKVDSRYPYYFKQGTLISNNHMKRYRENEVEVVSPVKLDQDRRKKLIQVNRCISKGRIKEIILVPNEGGTNRIYSTVYGRTYFADSFFWLHRNANLSKKYLKEEWEEAVQCAKEAP